MIVRLPNRDFLGFATTKEATGILSQYALSRNQSKFHHYSGEPNNGANFQTSQTLKKSLVFLNSP
jgi:hypothetical protein